MGKLFNKLFGKPSAEQRKDIWDLYGDLLDFYSNLTDRQKPLVREDLLNEVGSILKKTEKILPSGPFWFRVVYDPIRLRIWAEWCTFKCYLEEKFPRLMGVTDDDYDD